MIADEKKALRLKISAQTAALDETYIEKSNREIFERVLLLPEFNSAKVVFAYFSVAREVDTKALISFCARQNKLLALPRTKKGGEMDFALVTAPTDTLPKGSFGIPEPPDDAIAVCPGEADIIIVPALCFDENGFRLGHGGGYYDRYLQGCPAFTVGLCREKLMQRAVPAESHDIPVLAVITENKIARPLRISQA